MKKGVTKQKFCISLDKKIFDVIEKKCKISGIKRSTYIERILTKSIRGGLKWKKTK